MKRQSSTFVIGLCLTAVILPACIFSTLTAPKATTPPLSTATAFETATPVKTATPTATATQTPRPSSTPRPTPTHDLEATEQYQNMTAKVQEYYQAGHVSTDQGTYRRLPSYVESWAQIDWYQWEPVEGGPLGNFILRSKIRWQSASKSPNPSGCGFVFRLQEKNRDHYMFFVSLDGYVYASVLRSEIFQQMGRGYYAPVSLDSEEMVTLIVEDTSFRILVDDRLIKRFEGLQKELLSGYLAYTILSGTNKGYGTRCIFEQTDLWTIQK